MKKDQGNGALKASDGGRGGIYKICGLLPQVPSDPVNSSGGMTRSGNHPINTSGKFGVATWGVDVKDPGGGTGDINAV